MDSEILVALVHVNLMGGAPTTRFVPIEKVWDIVWAEYFNGLHPGRSLGAQLYERFQKDIAHLREGEISAFEIVNGLSMAWSHVAVYRRPDGVLSRGCVCTVVSPVGEVRSHYFRQTRFHVCSRISDAWRQRGEHEPR